MGWVSHSPAGLYSGSVVMQNTHRHLLLALQPPGCLHNAIQPVFCCSSRCWILHSDGWGEDAFNSGSVEPSLVQSFHGSLRETILRWAYLMMMVVVVVVCVSHRRSQLIAVPRYLTESTSLTAMSLRRMWSLVFLEVSNHWHCFGNVKLQVVHIPYCQLWQAETSLFLMKSRL